MNFVLFTVFCNFTLFLSSSANRACFRSLPDSKPNFWRTKEHFQEIVNKAFNELYNESAPRQPLNIEFCAKLDPEANCMRLSPYNDTRCTKMGLSFTLENKLDTFQCIFPESEQCLIECHIWIGELNVTTIYQTGQTFDFKYGWGEHVEAVLQIGNVPFAPISKITGFKYSSDPSHNHGLLYEIEPLKEKHPPGACKRDVRDAYENVVFREEAVRDKLVKQYH